GSTRACGRGREVGWAAGVVAAGKCSLLCRVLQVPLRCAIFVPMNPEKALRGKQLATLADDALTQIASDDAHFLAPWQRDFARWLAERKRRNADSLAKLFDLT